MEPSRKRCVRNGMSSSNAGYDKLLWLGFVLMGAAGGLVLGNYVVGDEAANGGGLSSYAELTGNPNAIGPAPVAIDDCYDCSGGYGRGIRYAVDNRAGMDSAFRELGAVEMEYGAEPDTDYAYGGRFDDPAAARVLAARVIEVPAPLPDAPVQLAAPSADPPMIAEPAAEATQ